MNKKIISLIFGLSLVFNQMALFASQPKDLPNQEAKKTTSKKEKDVSSVKDQELEKKLMLFVGKFKKQIKKGISGDKILLNIFEEQDLKPEEKDILIQILGLQFFVYKKHLEKLKKEKSKKDAMDLVSFLFAQKKISAQEAMMLIKELDLRSFTDKLRSWGNTGFKAMLVLAAVRTAIEMFPVLKSAPCEIYNLWKTNEYMHPVETFNWLGKSSFIKEIIHFPVELNTFRGKLWKSFKILLGANDAAVSVVGGTMRAL